MGKYIKNVLALVGILLVLGGLVSLSHVKAESLQLGDATLYYSVPDKILVGQEFTIEIGFDVKKTITASMARLAMQYPSEYIKIKQVTLNKNFFCKYPDDSNNRLLDEANGRLILTGMADGTADCPYPQLKAGNRYALVQITFIALKSGVVNISFMYNKSAVDGDFTFLTANGSPPVMVLGEPSDLELLLAQTNRVTPTPPHTGIVDGQLGMAVFILTVAILMLIVPKLKRIFSLKKSRTIVYQ